MANFVKVEYNIIDVQSELTKAKEKPKRRPISSGRKLTSSPPQSSNNNNNNNNNSNRIPNKPNLPQPPTQQPQSLPPYPVAAGGAGLSAREPRDINDLITPPKIIQKPNPSSSINPNKRPDPSAKRKPPLEPWKFSEKGIDRDLLILEQDVHISEYRHRHPGPYDNNPNTSATKENPMKSPHFTKESIHHSNILPRIRPFSKTSGTIVNNQFPLYPFLKTNLDHGIHDTRWNVMSVQQDDPDRCKPEYNQPGKSHDDFDRSYNYCMTLKPRDHIDVLNNKVMIDR